MRLPYGTYISHLNADNVQATLITKHQEARNVGKISRLTEKKLSNCKFIVYPLAFNTKHVQVMVPLLHRRRKQQNVIKNNKVTFFT